MSLLTRVPGLAKYAPADGDGGQADRGQRAHHHREQAPEHRHKNT